MEHSELYLWKDLNIFSKLSSVDKRSVKSRVHSSSHKSTSRNDIETCRARNLSSRLMCQAQTMPTTCSSSRGRSTDWLRTVSFRYFRASLLSHIVILVVAYNLCLLRYNICIDMSSTRTVCISLQQHASSTLMICIVDVDDALERKLYEIIEILEMLICLIQLNSTLSN